jgi:peptidoglycan lytic transglycosylase G
MIGGFWRKKRDKSEVGGEESGAAEDFARDVSSLPADYQDQTSVPTSDYVSDPPFDPPHEEDVVQPGEYFDQEPDIGPEPDDYSVHAEPATESDYERIYPRSPAEAIQPEVGPLPPITKRKKSSIFALLNGLISAIIFFVLIGAGILFVGFRQFTAEGPLTETRNVIIPQGDSLTSIATRLEREGIVADAYVFLAGVSVAQASNQLKAGEYLFQEGVSMREVLRKLTEGKSILHGITFPEGRTSQQIVEILRADPILVGDIIEVPPEGSLLPETYKFSRGDDRQGIIDRMRQARDRELARVWATRDTSLPLQSPGELVTLASIVEKETGRADERPQVAAVFVNRLRQGIRLQSDPTIIYGIVGGQGSLGRPIRQSELDAVTPYNTYKIDGLPPTPIANPGIAALEATANPSKTNFLFFVADGTGGHAFAATLAEHQRNVARWRQIETQAAAAPAPADPDEDSPTGDDSDSTLPPMPQLNRDLTRPLVPPPAQ